MIELGTADRNRVPNPESWGRYFDYDPRLMAVDDRAAIEPRKAALRPTSRQFEANARIF